MDIHRTKAYVRLHSRKNQKGKILPVYTNKDVHVCANCSVVYEGLFCNNCGQSCHTEKFTYKSVIKNFFGGLTNIDQGFFFSIKELFIRPGYMVRDYIGGRRVLYFRPLQMLFVLGAIYMLMVQAIDPASLKEAPVSVAKELELEWGGRNLLKWVTDSPFIQSVYGVIKTLFSSNKALEIVCTLPFLALATQWAFRKRVNKVHYNLVELFFVRTYAASQLLIVSMIMLPFTGDASKGTPWWLDFIFSVWIYSQLFNTKLSTTVKRTVLMYLYAGVLIVAFVVLALAFVVVLAWTLDLYKVN